MLLRPLRKVLLAMFTWLIVSAALNPALAQDAEDVHETEVAADDQSIPPDSLVVTDTSRVNPATIVLQLDQTAQSIHDAGERIGQVEGIEGIARQLGAHSIEVDSLYKMYTDLPEFKLSLRDLSNIERVWARLHVQGDDWDKTLVGRLEELEEVEVWLDDERRAWRTIESEATPLDYSLFESRIARLFSQMDDLDVDVKSRLQTIVELSDLLDNQLLLTDQIGEGLALRLTRARSSLFERDGVFLFKALFTEQSFDMSSDLIRATDRDMQALRAYVLTYPERFVRFGLALLFFLVVGFLIRRRSVTWDPNRPAVAGLKNVVDRPASVAILLSLLSGSLIFQDAPLIMADIMRLIALVPIVRILPGMIPASLRMSLFVFLGLMILHFTNEFFRVGSPVERMIVLLSSSGIALMVGYFLYGRTGFSVLSKSIWWRLTVVLLHVSVIALVGVVLANLFGYSSLSKVLSANIFISIYTGLAVYAAVQILEGAWALMLSSILARKLHSIRLHNAVFYKRGVFLIRFAMVYWWVDRALSRFGISGEITDRLNAIVSTEFSFGALTIDLGNIVAFIFTMWLTVMLSRLVRFFLQNDVYPRLSLRRGMSSAMSSLINYSILAIGFLTAFSAAGMDFQNVTLLAGAFGIGIGFGLQSIVNNFLSGLILIFERPIQVGDTIEFQSTGQSTLAQVKRIGIRASVVRSLDGAEIIIPNANLVSNDVTNWTKSDQLRRVEVKVGVAYGSDPDEVLALLHEVVDNHPEILPRPEPVALFMEFGESALNFAVRGWTPDFDNYLTLRSELTAQIFRALKKAEITIPFPQRDLHIMAGDQNADEKADSDLRPDEAVDPAPK